MKKSSCRIYVIFLAVILTVPFVFSPNAALATEYSFSPIDVPGATYTYASGINDSGIIVGYYGDAMGSHGFVASPVSKPISINIKPGDHFNLINPKSKGKIAVAILSTKDFDAPHQIDLKSLTFGRTGDEESLAFCRVKHANRDGRRDLVCHFYTQHTGFQCGDTRGTLKGKTLDGTPIEGSDSVRIWPCKIVPCKHVK